MAEEATEAPEETQDTSQEDSAPEETGTPAEPEIDYKQRYESLHPEYTRLTQFQAVLEGRHGPDAQADALARLGYDLDEGEADEEPEYQDPDDRISKLEAQFEQQSLAAQDAQLVEQEDTYIAEAIDGIERELGHELTDSELDFIATASRARRAETGEPDIQGAYQLLTESSKAQRERYLKTKSAPQAPAGSPGAKKIDTSSREGRQAAMLAEVQRVNAMEEDE